MDKYKVLKSLGEGTFGSVIKAVNNQTNEVVAIKKLKSTQSWEEATQQMEIKALKKLSNHPNIIKIFELIRKNEAIYIVQEFCQRSLLSEMDARAKANKPFSEYEIKIIVGQALSAIQYCHRNGLMHRDIKPENFLVKDPNDEMNQSPWTQKVLKLIDFGSARELNEGQNASGPFTDYVGTRWYRSPELVLGATSYDHAIDVFAVGCIMGELYLGRPLFPGQNSQDQLLKIVSILGSPSQSEWPQGHRLSEQSGLKFPQMSPTPFSSLVKNRDCSSDALDLLTQLLYFDPKKRSTAQQALSHPYFREVQNQLLAMTQTSKVLRIQAGRINFNKLSPNEESEDKNQSKSALSKAESKGQIDGGNSQFSQHDPNANKRMSKYGGGFGINSQSLTTNPPLQSAYSPNFEQEFKSKQEVSTINNNSSIFKGPKFMVSSVQQTNKGSLKIKEQLQAEKQASDSFYTPQRETSYNKKFLNIGSQLVGGGSSNTLNQPQQIQISSQLNGRPAMTIQEQQRPPSSSQQYSNNHRSLNPVIVNAGGANSMMPESYVPSNNRVLNNQRRAFIPDYAQKQTPNTYGSGADATIGMRSTSLASHHQFSSSNNPIVSPNLPQQSNLGAFGSSIYDNIPSIAGGGSGGGGLGMPSQRVPSRSLGVRQNIRQQDNNNNNNNPVQTQALANNSNSIFSGMASKSIIPSSMTNSMQTQNNNNSSNFPLISNTLSAANSSIYGGSGGFLQQHQNTHNKFGGLGAQLISGSGTIAGPSASQQQPGAAMFGGRHQF